MIALKSQITYYTFSFFNLGGLAIPPQHPVQQIRVKYFFTVVKRMEFRSD